MHIRRWSGYDKAGGQDQIVVRDADPTYDTHLVNSGYVEWSR